MNLGTRLAKGITIPKAFGFEAATHSRSVLLGGSLKRKSLQSRVKAWGWPRI